jgi:hypothetical protein
MGWVKWEGCIEIRCVEDVVLGGREVGKSKSLYLIWEMRRRTKTNVERRLGVGRGGPLHTNGARRPLRTPPFPEGCFVSRGDFQQKIVE